MKNPKNLLFIVFLVYSVSFNAQIGIGTGTPNSNAVLDVYSTSQGVKFPTLSTSERMAISSPAEGLMVFDTDLDCLMINRAEKTHDWECLGNIGDELINGAENDWEQLFLNWNTTQDNGGVGVVRSIRIKPDDTSSVLIGASTAGIWQTTDSGETYRFASGGTLEVEWVNEIVFSRLDPQIAYAGTDVGVIKSIDGGASWEYTSLRKHKPSKYSRFIWVDVSDTSSSIVYATTEDTDANPKYKLHKSIDGGATWNEMYTTNQIIWDMRVKLDDPNTVYILEQSTTSEWINFKRSTNSGQNFATINNGFPSNHNIKTTRARLATTPANNDVVYIAIGDDDDIDKIAFYKSSNGGTSFEKKCCGSSNVKLVDSYGTTDYLSGNAHLAQLLWNFAFTVSETDENFLACAANKLKISTDGGLTWSYDRSGDILYGYQYDSYPSSDAHTGIHGDHHGLSIIGDHIWNGNDGGVYYSSNKGMTLVKDKSDGLGIQELWGFSQSFKNDIMAVGLNHNRTSFRDDSVYGGWIAVRGADAMSANVNPIEDQYTYNHPWNDERITRSLTSKTGHIIESLGISLGYFPLDNIEFDPHNYFTFYSGNYGNRNEGVYQLMKTTNNADSWSVINSFVEEEDNAVCVKVSFANSNYVYAVLEPKAENVSKPNRVIKSMDAGTTWTEIAPPEVLTNNNDLWRLAVSDTNPEHLWVTTAKNNHTPKVFHTRDGGTTWTDFSAGLPNHAIYSLIYQRGSDDLLYVGTTFGVYYRKTGMAQWELFGRNLPFCKTSFMFINYAKGKLRLGTSRGLYEMDLYELTPPKANITANRSEITLEDSVVKFADYSVADKDATYLWEFSGVIPSFSTEERPTVTYDRNLQNSFDVTLTVTDKRGTSTQTITDFFNLPATVESFSSEQPNGNEAIYAIDGLDDTFWHSRWYDPNPSHPHELVIDLGGLRNITGITYLPRQSGGENGWINGYEIYVTEDLNNWGDAVATGNWTESTDLKTVNFATSKVGRYYKLIAVTGFKQNTWAAVAEIKAITDVLEIQYPRVYDFDSQETAAVDSRAVNAVDGDTETYWHSEWNGVTDQLPHWIVVDLGETKTITGLNYLSRQVHYIDPTKGNVTDNGRENGRISEYEIYVSDDPNNWGNAIASGIWESTDDMRTANFPATSGRYYKLVALSEVNGQKFTNAVEISVITE